MKEARSRLGPLRLGILASGTGTNVQAILDRISDGRLDARVMIVVSNNIEAPVLKRAENAGVETVHWSERKAGSPQRFAAELLHLFRRAEVELVVLAGYMKLVPQPVVEAYAGRMINVHPALLPKFGGKGYYGMRVHEAVLKSGDSESGATVHFVDEVYDRGPILMQRRVPVLPGDTPESLRERVLAVEHDLLPDAIAEFASRRHRDRSKRNESI